MARLWLSDVVTGGIHSSSLTLQAFIMALYWVSDEPFLPAVICRSHPTIQFPDVQEKGQREVDRAVGYGNIRQSSRHRPLTSLKKPESCCSNFR